MCGAGCGSEPAKPATSDVLQRAVRYLWAQQAPDGGWHSGTYGILKSGQALTPFVLHALTRVPPSIAATPKKQVDRAIGFLRKHLTKDGALGRSDPDLSEYPSYATALGVRVMRNREPEVARRMTHWLRHQQLNRERAWSPSHAAFGSWGLGGLPRRAPHAGHVDLSMTRHVMESLVGSAGTGQARRDGLHFVDRCRAADGSYFFSPVVLGANKAGGDADDIPGYGTTTADAILAMLAAGVPREDERVARALAWLVRHHGVGRVPGLPAGNARDWGAGMRHYYRAVSAQVFRALDVTLPGGRDWRQELRAALAREQKSDGRFQSESPLMKEDDPLIATGLAVLALCAAHEDR